MYVSRHSLWSYQNLLCIEREDRFTGRVAPFFTVWVFQLQNGGFFIKKQKHKISIMFIKRLRERLREQVSERRYSIYLLTLKKGQGKGDGGTKRFKTKYVYFSPVQDSMCSLQDTRNHMQMLLCSMLIRFHLLFSFFFNGTEKVRIGVIFKDQSNALTTSMQLSIHWLCALFRVHSAFVLEQPEHRDNWQHDECMHVGTPKQDDVNQ